MGGLMAMIVGVIAIVFAKFVLPKLNEKMAAKQAAKEEEKEA